MKVSTLIWIWLYTQINLKEPKRLKLKLLKNFHRATNHSNINDLSLEMSDDDITKLHLVCHMPVNSPLKIFKLEHWNGIPRTRVRVPVEMHVFHISSILPQATKSLK